MTVAGWLVRINGKKYPRGHFDGDDTPDWTYRYTPGEGNTEAGKKDRHRKSIGRGQVDGMVIHAIINITKGEN